MDYKEFLDKHGLNDMSVDMFPSFLMVLDYLYTSRTRDQAINVVADYYDNADDIYNSIQDNVDIISEKINSFIQELVENINNIHQNEDKEIKDNKNDFEA